MESKKICAIRAVLSLLIATIIAFLSPACSSSASQSQKDLKTESIVSVAQDIL